MIVRRTHRHRARIAAGVLLGAVAGCFLAGLATAAAGEDPAQERPEFTERQLRRIARLSPLGVAPADPTNAVADDPRAVRLGERLFSDPSLSGDGSISCATCHDPARDFTDGRALPHTIAEGSRNTPSLWNAAWAKSFFWDGRATTLWGQSVVPIEDPREMGGDRLAVLRRIAADPGLRAEFEALFGPWPEDPEWPARAMESDPDDARGGAVRPTAEWRALSDEDRTEIDMLFAQVGKALAAYQRTLVSGSTPFDRFAARLSAKSEPEADPDEAADPEYPAAAERGLALFVGKAGCHQCHHGPTLSDSAFHATRVAPAEGRSEDPGRYAAFPRVRSDPFRADGPHSDDTEGDAALRARISRRTGDDFGAFRTPGLRNVARTAPYFHAGQIATLEGVVRFYSDRTGALPPDPAHDDPLIAPLGLSEREITDLVAFLETLSDLPENAKSGEEPEDGRTDPTRDR